MAVLAFGIRRLCGFVGSNNSRDNRSYLKEWPIIIADWIKEGFHPYVFIHAPNYLSQPSNARLFHQLLSEMVELQPMPKWPSERQDEQLDLF